MTGSDDSLEIGALVRRAVERSALPCGFDVVVSVDPLAGFADGAMLEWVLGALLRFSLSLQDRRRGSITIGITEGADLVRVSVSDDGPGLASLSRQWGSELTKIGRIVEAYGGTLAVASEPPHGTTIAFTWPRGDSRSARRGGEGMSKSIRVLIAEDSPDDAELLKRELRRGGFDVALERVETEPAFARALDEERWDLIVSDHNMPEFSGGRALEIYRERNLDVPFIIVSGTVGEDVAVESMRRGVHDYLIKGNLSRLCSAVERELREAENRRKTRELTSALEIGERRYRSIFDSASVSLWEVDLSRLRPWLAARGIDGATALAEYEARSADALVESAKEASVLDVNDTTLSLFDVVDEARMVGSFDRALAFGLTGLWRLILEAIAEGKTRILAETSATTSKGRTLQLLLSAHLPANEDELENVVLTVCDTTERSELEAQMRASQRMEAVGRLAGGIAHDFNNVLCVIQSYSGFLRERFEADEQASSDIAAIEDATSRAARLTSQLLAFGRRQVQQRTVIDLNGSIRDLSEMLPRLIREDVQIRTSLADDLGLVRADATQIEQVLMNLAVNARDAMPDGGVLTIETANAEIDEVYGAARDEAVPAGSYVMLAVSDTGTGMDEETRTKIFEPFFTTKAPGKGTGLGLSTTFGIVKQSEGFIWVYSELGRGTTFKIYLPRVRDSRPSPKPRIEASSVLTGSETVLIVENEDRVREAAARILERHGYRVLAVDRGSTALDLVRTGEEPIHLLLTDVVMPEMSGVRLSEHLGALQPDIKVVFMSGYTGGAIAQHGVLDEGAPLVQKPFSHDTLLEAVRRRLDG